MRYAAEKYTYVAKQILFEQAEIFNVHIIFFDTLCQSSHILERSQKPLKCCDTLRQSILVLERPQKSLIGMVTQIFTLHCFLVNKQQTCMRCYT